MDAAAPCKPATVRAAVLADLRAGRRITHADCWKAHGSSRLAAHIHKLRSSGWPIKAERISVPTSGGHVARIARYWLEASA
ncbi:MAG: helix-turn-helix domain-containing protein [Algiphilus sp.]